MLNRKPEDFTHIFYHVFSRESRVDAFSAATEKGFRLLSHPRARAGKPPAVIDVTADKLYTGYAYRHLSPNCFSIPLS